MFKAEFVGRSRELEVLNNLWESQQARLLILYGRRRVGKKRLLTHWLQSQEKRGLYWVAEPASALTQLRSFSQALISFIDPEADVPPDFTFSSWELAFRQLRNSREADLAPFGLRMDTFRFDGSFLSLAIDLPPDAIQGLRKRHVVRLDSIIEIEKPLEIFARLNIRHGPNTEQIVRELPLYQDDITAEFDLTYTRLNEKRVEHMWLDLIFEGPEMNQITMRDLTFSRHPRAEL